MAAPTGTWGRKIRAQPQVIAHNQINIERKMNLLEFFCLLRNHELDLLTRYLSTLTIVKVTATPVKHAMGTKFVKILKLQGNSSVLFISVQIICGKTIMVFIQ